MALPQANRLKRRAEFQEVYQRGLRRSGRYFKVLALRQRGGAGHSPQAKPAEVKNHRTHSKTQSKTLIRVGIQGEESKQPTRIGISISQKVSKLAVIRNRIKRQIRAALRLMLPQIPPGWLLVIVVLQGAQECDYAQILRELEQLLVEAELLNGH